ncbi:hypothetical protein M1B78_08520 [Bacteroides sp. KH569_7]|uniref:Uncharacterized protein n=1 Tax=Bacteroides muris (ex Fokt et al. 2023) TaxID=2937417 RepID=A0A9X2NYD4_9BACE|nr:hypothetical protein [Bacteroides muris (ex Fokt et al. 2023)]MCR6508204.1 hypothetical protein [Bacteroides muris (ex Fokt et al. 2023)]
MGTSAIKSLFYIRLIAVIFILIAITIAVAFQFRLQHTQVHLPLCQAHAVY